MEAFLTLHGFRAARAMLVELDARQRNISVRKVRADEAVFLVVRDQPPALAQGGQVDPFVIIGLDVLDLQKGRALDVGREGEFHQQLGVDAVRLEDRVGRALALARLALVVDEHHGTRALERLDLGDDEVLLHHVMGAELCGREATPKAQTEDRQRGSDRYDSHLHWLLPAGAAKSAWGLSPKMNLGLNSIMSARREKSANTALIVMVVNTTFEICV